MPDEVTKTESTPAASAKYRRVIDLGDGRNPQVFESDGPLEFTPEQEKFIDKLVDSNGHGTRHIRKLEAENRELRSKGEKDNDVRAFTDEKKDEIDFEHTEAGEKNTKLMLMGLASKGIPATRANLHAVYDDLKASGLLTLKGEEAHGKTEEPERIAQAKVEAEPQRIAESVANATPQRTKRVTIGTQNRTPVQPASTEPSEYDLYHMPMDKLRDISNKQLGRN